MTSLYAVSGGLAFLAGERRSTAVDLDHGGEEVRSTIASAAILGAGDGRLVLAATPGERDHPSADGPVHTVSFTRG